MNKPIKISEELLRQIDFDNTVNGGTIQPAIQAWRAEDGYRMVVYAPSVDPDDIHIKTENQQFNVFYTVQTADGMRMPRFLVKLPLSPEVDVEGISAKLQEDGGILIEAPFNDWAQGNSRRIDIDRY